MAIATITGNQVEIPDFALQNTQESILEKAGQILAALGGVTSEVSQSNNTDQAILREEKKQTADNRKTSKESMTVQRQGLKNLRDGILTSQTNVTGLFDNTLKSLGAPTMMGVGAGLMTQQALEIGDAFRIGGRAGINFSESLVDTASTLASVGIDLGEFSQIVLGNLSGIRAFGSSTQQGAERFSKLLTSFRSAAEGFGNFGLTSGASAELLAEELELRRLTMTSDAFRAQTEQEITNSMVERIKQEEAMAKITGQDVKERLKAQMEMRKNAIVQSFMAEQTEETREKMTALASSLSAMGPAGEEVSKAIRTAISTNMDPSMFSQVFNQLGAPARDLFENIAGSIFNDNMSTEDFAAATQQNLGDLKQAQADLAPQLRIRAAMGDSVAESMLGIQRSLVDINKGELSLREQYVKNLKEATEQEGKIRSTARGTSALTEEMEKSFQLQILRLVDAMGKGATGENLGTAAIIQKLVGSINDGLQSDFLADRFQEAGLFLGNQFFEPIVNASKGLDNLERSDIGALIAYLTPGLPASAKALLLAEQTAESLILAGSQLKKNLEDSGIDMDMGFGDMIAKLDNVGLNSDTLSKLGDIILGGKFAGSNPAQEQITTAQDNNQTPVPTTAR